MAVNVRAAVKHVTNLMTGMVVSVRAAVKHVMNCTTGMAVSVRAAVKHETNHTTGMAVYAKNVDSRETRGMIGYASLWAKYAVVVAVPRGLVPVTGECACRKQEEVAWVRDAQVMTKPINASDAEQSKTKYESSGSLSFAQQFGI